MKALVFEPERKLFLDNNFPEPKLEPGEAIVKVRRAGICDTDLQITRGYMNYRGILGHEFVGTVEAVESRADSEWVGQRVVGEINAACHQCAMCQKGYPTHCLKRSVLGIANRNGAMAQYLSLPLENLHHVPDNVSDTQAAFVEPLAAACEVLQQVHVRPTDHVAIIGDGKLGLLIAQVLSMTGAQINLVGHHCERSKFLAGKGINFVDTSGENDQAPTKRLDALRLSDIVVECTGNEAGLGLAKQLVRPRGTIVLKSTYHGEPKVPLSMFVVDEVNVVGSRCGPFEPALRMLQNKMVIVEPMLSNTFGLDQAETAFQRAFEPGVLKVQLQII